MKRYDVIIVGAGPGGIFSAYELTKKDSDLKIAVFETGTSLEKRKCPIDGKKVKSCVGCKTCAIMNGFGGAGAFSDGKYNITNQFGGNLYEYIGKQEALDLMHCVDEINLSHGLERVRHCILRQIPRLKSCVSPTDCICWMLPCGIWEQILIMWYWKICIRN